jgi:hypothetical protein
MNRAAGAVWGALVLIFLGCSQSYADPVTGTYAVTLRTEKGSCDETLLWKVGVRQGRIATGGLFVKMSGAVDDGGGLSLVVRSGRDVLTAAGKLSPAGGAGTWRSPSRSCSGRWVASAT